MGAQTTVRTSQTIPPITPASSASEPHLLDVATVISRRWFRDGWLPITIPLIVAGIAPMTAPTTIDQVTETPNAPPQTAPTAAAAPPIHR